MTARRHFALAVAAVLAAVPLALAGGPDRPEVSEVVYPAQHLPLTFSHARHLARGALACTACHRDALTSRSALDVLLPTEAACAPCHPIDRARPELVVPGQPPARCVACHPGYDHATGAIDRPRVPPPNLKFDHRGHVVGSGIPCVRCHGDLRREGVDLATRAQLPAMALCLECHDDRRAPARCTVCHPSGAGGRIETRFTAGSLVPSGANGLPAHDPDFATRHGREAGADPRACATCHAEEECTACHVGVVKPYDFHPGDYVRLHTIDARRGTPDCSTCHRVATFCVGCHSRVGVAADGRIGQYVPPSEGPSPRRFHPAGWVDDDAIGLGARHHGVEAQRSLATCASCHRESFCTRCHSAEPGTPQINPHPAGWVGSRRCQALRSRNPRMCLRCHTEDEPLTCD